MPVLQAFIDESKKRYEHRFQQQTRMFAIILSPATESSPLEPQFTEDDYYIV